MYCRFAQLGKLQMGWTSTPKLHSHRGQLLILYAGTASGYETFQRTDMFTASCCQHILLVICGPFPPVQNPMCWLLLMGCRKRGIHTHVGQGFILPYLTYFTLYSIFFHKVTKSVNPATIRLFHLFVLF